MFYDETESIDVDILSVIQLSNLFKIVINLRSRAAKCGSHRTGFNLSLSKLLRIASLSFTGPFLNLKIEKFVKKYAKQLFQSYNYN